MKKFCIILIICIFILSGCKKKELVSEHSLIVQLSSDMSIVQSDVKTMSKTNKIVFEYDKDDVGKYDVTLYLYYSPTCPHCKAELEWLKSIEDEYKYLKIVTKQSSKNKNEYKNIVSTMNINDYHVPLTIIGGTYYIGYSEKKNEDLISTIEYYSTFDNCDMVDSIINGEDDIKECKQINKK